MIRTPSFAEVLAVSRSHGRNSDAPGLWGDARGLWTMIQGGGHTLYDVSGYDNHGTLTNMDPSSDWVATEKGWALDFDGATDSVQTATIDSTLALTGGIGTVAAWVFEDTVDTNRVLICHARDTSNVNEVFWALYRHNTARFAFAVGDGAGRDRATSGVFVGAQNALVVGQIDGTNITVQAKNIDGVVVSGSEAQTKTPITNRGIGIGASSNADRNFTDGRIPFAAVWDRVLSPSEIQHLYTDPSAMFRRRRRVFAVSGVAPPAFGGFNHIIGGGIAA